MNGNLLENGSGVSFTASKKSSLSLNFETEEIGLNHLCEEMSNKFRLHSFDLRLNSHDETSIFSLNRPKHQTG